MGGRGASSGGGNLVPYNSWGKDVDEVIRDKDGNLIGTIEDRTVFVYEHQLDEIGKQDAINFALGFYSKADGGWIVDDDYSINLAYQDGTFRNVADNPSKPLNRKGLIGVSVSTPDEEISWGGNTSKYGFQQWGVHDENGDEVTGNYHSWYKATGKYKERVKATFNNPNGKGGYKTEREVIRKSTTVPMNQ